MIQQKIHYKTGTRPYTEIQGSQRNSCQKDFVEQICPHEEIHSDTIMRIQLKAIIVTHNLG